MEIIWNISTKNIARPNLNLTTRSMTPFIAADYGAGYASRIEKITRAAASMRAIAEARSAYEYFLKK